MAGHLLVTFWTQIASPETIFLHIFQQDPSGNLIESIETFSVDSSANGNERVITLTDGQLISAVLWSNSNSLRTGQLFARIATREGSVADNSRELPLVSGYITGGSFLNYPTSPPIPSYTGVPALEVVAVPAPGAGNEISFTQPGGTRSRIIGGSFIFTTSAAVANRTVTLQVNDISGAITWVTSRTVQAAGVARTYWLWTGDNMPADAAPNFFLPIPADAYGDELNVISITTNIDVADAFTAVTLRLDNYVNPA